jgi:hypothetical protein
MPRMIGDAEVLMDETGTAPTRPESTAKAEGFSALLQQLGKLCELGWAQQRSGTRGRVGTQSGHSLKRGAFEPLADGPLASRPRLRRYGFGSLPVGAVPRHVGGDPRANSTAGEDLLCSCERAEHIPVHQY